MNQNEILRLEADRRAAMLDADADRLAALFDEDAVYYPGAGGRQSGREMVEALRNGSVRYEEIDVVDENVAMFSGVAVVTGLLVMRVVVAGEPILNRRRITDVWIKQAEGWRLAVYHGALVDADPGEIQAEIDAGIRRALQS